MISKNLFLTVFFLSAGIVSLFAQTEIPSLKGFQDGIHHWNLEHKDRSYQRYSPEQYIEIADNFIAYQNEDGGWPKNIDWLAKLPTDSVKVALKESYRRSTMDNRNTFPQIEYLGDVYVLTREDKYRQAALKGLNYLLKMQNKSGGWRGWDVDAITFNDEVTTGALELFLKINRGDNSFKWLDDSMKKRIYEAFNHGLDVILKCQYIQNGVKTAWGQQHDHVTFLPVKARSYELPSLTANETCSILELLMNIPYPSNEIVESVKAAVEWLKKVQIKNLRVERVPLPEEKIINHEYPYDNVVVKDKKAKPIWARFYELKDNTPFMCTRAGQKVWKLEDVNAERRTGYDWYGYWPEKVFEKYEEWLEKVRITSQYQGYEVMNTMPSFFEKLKDNLSFPMAWGNSSIKDFALWRKEARKVLLDCMEPSLPIADFDMEVLAVEKRLGYEAQKILFNVSDYSRVPAYLLVPDGEGPFPALVLLHDHGAHFTIGKEKLVRPFGVDELVLEDADRWAETCYEKQYVGDYLAANGYVVLVVDALFWGERGRKEGANYDAQQAMASNLQQMGMSWGAIIAWDDIRSAEFLATLSMVNKDKIGAMGFSMGAHRAWMLCAATDVVKAGAAVCWMNTTEYLMTMTNNQNKGGSAYSMIIPGIRNYMDYPHVASIACPKPMMFVNGTKDKLFPVEGVLDAYEIMKKVWHSQHVPENLVTKLYDLHHFCNKEIQKDLLKFFDEKLK